MSSPKQDVVVKDGAVYVLRPGTSIFVKTADICAMTGKSNQWVGQLVSQGTLNKRSTPHGPMFEVTASMKDYLGMVAAPEKSEDEIKREAAKNSADVTLKVSKATIAKLEAQELQGKMYRAEDIEAITEDLVYTVRGSLMALPGRLAVDVAAAQTPAESAEVIRKEVHKLMRELAQYHYDPKKYDERVRERRAWETNRRDDDDI